MLFVFIVLVIVCLGFLTFAAIVVLGERDPHGLIVLFPAIFIGAQAEVVAKAVASPRLVVLVEGEPITLVAPFRLWSKSKAGDTVKIKWTTPWIDDKDRRNYAIMEDR